MIQLLNSTKDHFMFRKDSVFFGLIIGILVPLVLFGIIYAINHFLLSGKLSESTIYLISVCGNLIPFRLFMQKFKYDFTGRGILIVTFVFAIFFLIRYAN